MRKFLICIVVMFGVFQLQAQEAKDDSIVVNNDHPSDTTLKFAEILPEFPGGK